MEILIPHGETNTGVGLSFTSDNEFILTTPCCGMPFVVSRSAYFCKKCEKDYTEESHKYRVNFTADFRHTTYISTLGEWIRRATGHTDLSLSIDGRHYS